MEVCSWPRDGAARSRRFCYTRPPVFGIPLRRLPLAVLMVLGLAGLLTSLQGRFDQADVKKAITIALTQPAWGAPGAKTVLDALTLRGEGDPLCDGQVVSTLFGDVEVDCALPRTPEVHYRFRVLLDGRKPPRADSPAAAALLLGGPERPAVPPAAPPASAGAPPASP